MAPFESSPSSPPRPAAERSLYLSTTSLFLSLFPPQLSPCVTLQLYMLCAPVWWSLAIILKQWNLDAAQRTGWDFMNYEHDRHEAFQLIIQAKASYSFSSSPLIILLLQHPSCPPSHSHSMFFSSSDFHYTDTATSSRLCSFFFQIISVYMATIWRSYFRISTGKD